METLLNKTKCKNFSAPAFLGKPALKIVLILLILAGILTSSLYSCAEKSVAEHIYRLQTQDIPAMFDSPECLFYGCKYIDSVITPEQDGSFSGTVTFQRNQQKYTRKLRIYQTDDIKTAAVVIDNDYTNNTCNLQSDADLLYNMYKTTHPEKFAAWQFKAAGIIAPGVIQYTLSQPGAERSLTLKVSEFTTDSGLPVIRCEELISTTPLSPAQ